MLIRGMFPGLELTNDDEGLNNVKSILENKCGKLKFDET